MAKIALNIRVDKDIRAAIIELAVSQNRSVSNLVETELRRIVEEYWRTVGTVAISTKEGKIIKTSGELVDTITQVEVS